ncbi:polysaccharide ABC transporter ATP-binding protein [Eisenibacter elegans]|jgi:lipopolysaccharide transport system ATP-binding protein|uniref:ABC transporter ATP-binding protein n=1 Tax=Eisenibacter elegans TaxID=997 RepID=UPI0003F6B296|nr:ABC transporter ATP-binding protein [Eisenibacter elegans]
MTVVLHTSDLAKRYYKGRPRPQTLREALSLWGKSSPSRQAFWALQDINLSIHQGETLGIVGPNGAGKSTLLKVLAKITAPTKGKVLVRGRVAALLEVGTGFHPELSGRENIYLRGGVLGMRKADIRARIDDIIDFSGVSAHIDTPVKRYSSGMYVRLGFAVAAHLAADILLIDEVLAVGDGAFQQQCQQKIKSLSQEGKTVVWVSHQLHTVATLCSRALLLAEGRVQESGTADTIIQAYTAQFSPRQTRYQASVSSPNPQFTSAHLETNPGGGLQHNGQPMRLHLGLHLPQGLRQGAVSVQVVRHDNIPVAHVGFFDTESQHFTQAGNYTLSCEFPQLRLYQGHYSLQIYLSDMHNGTQWEVLQDICSFEVTMGTQIRPYAWQPKACTYTEDAHWQIEKQ